MAAADIGLLSTFSALLLGCTDALDFLFILFDAGECAQLRGPIELLASLSSRSIVVLALGSPATQIFSGKSYLRTLSDMGINQYESLPPNGRSDPSRSQLLSDSALAKLTSAWPSVLVVVPGMAYKMQAQIAQAWPDAHVDCALDGWSLWDGSSSPAVYFLDAQRPACSELLVPTGVQRASFREWCKRGHLTEMGITVVGAPSLEDWRSAAGDVGLVRHAKKALYGDRRGILLAGGYGDGHRRALKVFCDASKQMREHVFAYAPHPGPGEEALEDDMEVFQTNSCAEIVVIWNRYIQLSNGQQLKVDTKLASAASLATTSHYSTVGGQSLYIGIPHAYIDGLHLSHSDVFSKYITAVKSGEELVQWIRGLGSKAFDSTVLGNILSYHDEGSSSHAAAHLLNVSNHAQNDAESPTMPTNCSNEYFSGVVQGGGLMLPLVTLSFLLWRWCAPKQLQSRDAEIELPLSS